MPPNLDLLAVKRYSTVKGRKKGVRMSLEKAEAKVSLNIKVSKELDMRLKRARKLAREAGLRFNVSKEVENFLEKELKKVEKELSITQDIKEEQSQLSLIDDNKEKSAPKKGRKK